MRDRSRAICEMLSDNQKLQEEREYAKKTRDKLSGISAGDISAAPASGKYGGFGSEDINKYGAGNAGGGYNPNLFNNQYDPYTKS